MSVLLEERPRIYTPDDLLHLPEAKPCELLDGRLVEKPMQRLSEGDALTGGSVLPEFRCEVAEIIPPTPSGQVKE